MSENVQQIFVNMVILHRYLSKQLNHQNNLLEQSIIIFLKAEWYQNWRGKRVEPMQWKNIFWNYYDNTRDLLTADEWTTRAVVYFIFEFWVLQRHLVLLIRMSTGAISKDCTCSSPGIGYHSFRKMKFSP